MARRRTSSGSSGAGASLIFRPFFDFDHGCAGLSGKPSSTIGFEKRFTPALSLSRGEFVEALAVVAPKPAGADGALEFNRGRGNG